jgi:outer membrane protein
MNGSRFAKIGAVCCAVFCASIAARADDLPAPDGLPPSAWIVTLGGYALFEPTWLGSKSYTMSFRPIGEFRQAGDKEWVPFPNDALTYSFVETESFRAGPAGNFSLQSRLHGQDIDLRLGKADVNLQGGAFAEYYPIEYFRVRTELLQGITGNTGLAVNLGADYVWRFGQDLTITVGPRAQVVNDHYASQYFSTQIAYANKNNYVPYRAEGGVLTSGAELTSKYDWTPTVSTRFFLDYNQLMGDAADSPRVAFKGASEQVVVGLGATYKFTIEP